MRGTLKDPDLRPRVNFRLFFFCAAGIGFGAFLYSSIRFKWIAPSQFLLPVLLLLLAVFPFSKKRLLALFLCFFVFAGLGVGLFHLYTERYLSGPKEGSYTVEGTVVSVTVYDGYSEVVLSRLQFGGGRTAGKLVTTLSSEEIRPADKLSLFGKVQRNELPPADTVNFVENVRFTMSAKTYTAEGTSADPFLRLNAAIYNVLHEEMEREPADVGYALLTGNSGSVDGGILTAVRAGGIAHIFAVSGLHIGILYGVSLLIFRFCKRYSFLPASCLTFAYCAVCGFTVSSVRAAVMCLVLGTTRFFGKKYDLLHSLSFAAVFALLVNPADWLSVGFRLSFSAVLGLALFAGSFSRGLMKVKLPRVIAQTIAASLSVQILTFPILYETFGFYSLWGLLLNPILIPFLPVLFLPLLLCTMLSLIIPPAASFFCMFPEGMLSLFLLLLSVFDFSAVLTGFSLGVGGTILFTGAVLLSERVRFGKIPRLLLATVTAVCFAGALIAENCVFFGCRVDVYSRKGGDLTLVRTKGESVLIIDRDIPLDDCVSFLNTTYGGKLDGIVLLSEKGLPTAAFLDAEQIYFYREIASGFRDIKLVWAENFEVGELSFRYEDTDKLTVTAEGSVVEIDFEGREALGADLFIGTDTTATYYLHNGNIYRKR